MSPRAPLTGAIVGLGQIGFSFNADRKRRGVWSHERAYAASGAVRLVAAADPSPDARRRFADARPDVPVFADHREMLRRARPEFVSVCAPTRLHAAVVRDAVAAGARAVFDEKPIAATARDAAGLIGLCRRERVALAVNHTRRWDPAYLRAAAAVRRGAIGRVVSVGARYSGRVYNVGTHLLDAARMVSGLDARRACGFAPDPRAADPDVSGVLELTGGATMTLSAHGAPTDLLFELDLVGTEGRLRLLDNGATTVLERFRPSRRFAGHREPSKVPLAPAAGPDRFVAAVRDLARAARGGPAPACSGADGFAALAAAEALALSARRGGRPAPVARLPRSLEER